MPVDVTPRSPTSGPGFWMLILGGALLALILTSRTPQTVLSEAPTDPEKDAESRAPTSPELEISARRALEPGRGRSANAPIEIPIRGWKDIFWRTWDAFNRDRVLSVAAGVTFYVLLALFPALAALVSLYGFFADRATVGEHLGLLSGIFPDGALVVIRDQVERIAGQKSSLGFAFFGSLAVSLWTANAGMKGLFEAMNVVYGEDEKRSFLALNLRSLCFTLAAISFLLLALGAIVIVPVFFSFVGWTSNGERALFLLRWPLLFFVVLMVLAILYRYGPSRRNAKWKWITSGSVISALLWLSGTLAFSWYVANFANYNATYGSLGAAIGFMTWIWLSAIVVLLGGEFNAEVEHQTATDSTVGPAKPLGHRGAHMADTVGKGQD